MNRHLKKLSRTLAGKSLEEQVVILEDIRLSSDCSIDITLDLDRRLRETKEKLKMQLEKQNAQALIRRVQILLKDGRANEARSVVNIIRDQLYHQIQEGDMRTIDTLLDDLKKKETQTPNANGSIKALINRFKLLIADNKIEEARALADRIRDSETLDDLICCEFESLLKTLNSEETFQKRYEVLAKEHRSLSEKFQKQEQEMQRLILMERSSKGENHYQNRLVKIVAYVYRCNPSILPKRCLEQIRFFLQQENTGYGFDMNSVTNVSAVIEKNFGVLDSLWEIIQENG